MKRMITVLFLVAVSAGLTSAQVAYETPVSLCELITTGTTNTYYIGTATASATYTPLTNEVAWKVVRVVTVSDVLKSSGFGYRLSGAGNPALIKWSERDTTNTSYKVSQ